MVTALVALLMSNAARESSISPALGVKPNELILDLRLTKHIRLGSLFIMLIVLLRFPRLTQMTLHFLCMKCSILWRIPFIRG